MLERQQRQQPLGSSNDYSGKWNGDETH
jgi:hypothetical protein